MSRIIFTAALLSAYCFANAQNFDHPQRELQEMSHNFVDVQPWDNQTLEGLEDDPAMEIEPENMFKPVGGPRARGLALVSQSANCPVFSGIFRSSASSSTTFQQEVEGWSNAANVIFAKGASGYRLVDINARVDGSVIYFSMVFEPGSGGYYFFLHNNFADFTAEWATRSAAGYRLKRLETFVFGGTVRYVSYYRSGSGGYALYQYNSLSSFLAKKAELAVSGIQLLDFETFVVSGIRYYTGVFLSRSGATSVLEQGLSFSAFVAKWKAYANLNMRLIDFDRYLDGSATVYAGVFAPGTDGYALWAGVDEENMLAQIDALKESGNFLIGMEANNGNCKAECCNDVVGTSYNYQLTGDSEWYRWPVSDGKIRLTALQFSNPLFRLPFSDTSVKQTSGWRYTSDGLPGGYHHAIDYSKGSATFAVRAVQAGRVIYKGWDAWSGNTIVVEHANGWRSIYMHLRNGKTNDCNKARTVSLPNLSNPSEARTDYAAYLANSKCDVGQPLESYFGKESETILVNVNQQVARGTQLAWAGNTGPGGKRGAGLSANTHLHIFFTRLDTTDNRWYFVDPYGVYAYTGCYPSSVLGPLTTCTRYPIAWDLTNTGKIQYSA